jgi:hypothetical protein
VAIQQAILALTEHQGVLQSSIERTQALLLETQKALRELGEKTDARIAALVGAIAKLSEQQSRGPAAG